jgi:uncharacterized protein (TIGR03437 family)
MISRRTYGARLLGVAALVAAAQTVHAQQRILETHPIANVSGERRSVQARTAGACLAPPSGLVGWWPGDNNENDIVGGNNPSAVNAVTLAPGEVLDGFTFGTNGYIQIPQSPSLENQQFTWAAWVKPAGPGPENDRNGSVIVNQLTNGSNFVQLSWSASSQQFVFVFGDDSTEFILSSNTFAPGAFYFVTGTYDGSVFRLFVNGVLQGSLTETKTVSYSSAGWQIGGNLSANQFSRTWNGVIDEVQAFDRALSQSEIESIFNAASAGECKNSLISSPGACLAPPSGLVSWWPGDTNENDIVGGNNPSAVNAVTLAPGEVRDGFTFGNEGYIQIPQSPSLENQQFTWLAWARPDGPGPNKTNIMINQDIDLTDASVSLGWRSSDQRFTFLVGNTQTETLASADAFPSGTFYLVAGTYDGSAFNLYVNGVLEASLSESKTVAYSSSGWEIGSGSLQYFPGFPDTWVGIVDEVQAFNRPLSQPEIQSIFTAAGAGECKPAAISAGGVVSASAFGEFTSVSPGSWIEIYGSNLAVNTRGWTGADFNGINAPTSLDGTYVTIGSQAAFVDYISPSQVNALIPSNVATGTQQLTLTSPGGTTASVNLTVNPVEPGLLAPSNFKLNGTQYVVAQFADGAFVLPEGAIAGLNSRPAQPGDEIVLYGIGFGPVSPNLPAGQLVQQANTLASSLEMSVGGVPVTNVPYSGLAPGFTGLYQFNIVVPASTGTGAVPLTFTVGGVAGTQTLYLAVGN